MRNLRGELVFEDGRAAACLFHAPAVSDVFLNRQIRDRSAALGAKLPLAARRPCGANDLAKPGSDLCRARCPVFPTG